MLLLSKCCLTIAFLQIAKAYNALFCSWVWEHDLQQRDQYHYNFALFKHSIQNARVLPSSLSIKERYDIKLIGLNFLCDSVSNQHIIFRHVTIRHYRCRYVLQPSQFKLQFTDGDAVALQVGPHTVPCYCPRIVSLSHSYHSPGSIHLCHTTRQPIISAIITHNRVIEGERSQQGKGEPRHHTRHGYHESHSHCSVMMTSYNDVTVFEQGIMRQSLIREAADCIPFTSFHFSSWPNISITARNVPLRFFPDRQSF